MKLGIIQMHSNDDKKHNRARAEALVGVCAAQGATLACLPENFSWLGPDAGKPAAAEPVPGPTTVWLGDLARRLRIWLHGGSILEQAPGGRSYNTTAFFAPDGTLTATYRKIHLFDADIEDKTYRESDQVVPGTEVVTAAAGDLRVGLSICYDIRFPELFRTMSAAGVDIFFIPSAFTVPTGNAHWHSLVRARAIENQAFVAAPAQVGTDPAGKSYFGHSLVVDPWGAIIAELAGPTEGNAVADCDPERIAEVRMRLPALKHRKL
ncbi:MAG: carbon-nitrogen hydrolase family protein [Planctomycetota bacterium]